MEEREYVARNRAHWDEMATEYVASGETNWATEHPKWGIWGIPEAEVGLLPERLDGKDAIELGCGTGYVSAWLARRGKRMAKPDLCRLERMIRSNAISTTTSGWTVR